MGPNIHNKEYKAYILEEECLEDYIQVVESEEESIPKEFHKCRNNPNIHNSRFHRYHKFLEYSNLNLCQYHNSPNLCQYNHSPSHNLSLSHNPNLSHSPQLLIQVDQTQ